MTTTLLPRLESLEAYHLSSLTDEDLDMITRVIFVLSAFSVLIAKRVAEKKSQGCRPQSIAPQELVIHLPYDLSVRKHCFVAKHTSWIWFLAYLIARFIKKSFYSPSTCPCLYDLFFFIPLLFDACSLTYAFTSGYDFKPALFCSTHIIFTDSLKPTKTHANAAFFFFIYLFRVLCPQHFFSNPRGLVALGS